MSAGLAAVGAFAGLTPKVEAVEDVPTRRRPDGARGILVPTRMYVTSATASHERRARADDLVLCRAGIGNTNRVEVSSIVPPGCKLISREEGERFLFDGQVVFAVLGKGYSSTPGTKIASAIGIAAPEGGGTGCISEAQDSGPETSATYLTRRAVEAALGMLALRLKVDNFDPGAVYDPQKTSYMIGKTAVRVDTVSQEATVNDAGDPTFVLSSVVFLM